MPRLRFLLEMASKRFGMNTQRIAGSDIPHVKNYATISNRSRGVRELLELKVSGPPSLECRHPSWQNDDMQLECERVFWSVRSGNQTVRTRRTN